MKEEIQHTGAAAAPDATRDADLAPAPGEPPPLPPTAEALAGKAKDLQSLRDAVVDAASVGGGLWFSYLFVLFYLLIAAGGVTHRDLFLQSPVKLPFLNVDLPLRGFFWLGPAILLVVHAYVVLHFVLLAGKVGDFDTELRDQIRDKDVQKRLRRQLPSNIFVQFLAGPGEVRHGAMGFLLRLIAQISFVIGPIALLVFFELQFLPYHHEGITWWHRIAVLADVVLLWLLWPSIARGERATLAWRDLRRVKIVALAFASLAPVLLVTTIATFPGEWLEDTLPSLEFIPWKDGKDKSWRRASLHELPGAAYFASLHELLVAGEVDFATRKPKSLWANVLVLPDFDAIDHAKFDSEAKIEAASETVSLRARHLEGAVLIGAKLRKADFTAAQLQRARLDASDLRGAKFECPGRSLFGPLMKLPDCAQLQGAGLIWARLQGASLAGAQLQGASLDAADLQEASFIYAQLLGASLVDADARAAAFSGAQLQGAWLSFAQLQGAQLDNAQLQGALLDGAQLQGASLAGAQLQGASLEEILAWRADARKAVWGDTRVFKPETGPEERSVKSFEDLKKVGNMRSVAIETIEQRLDPTKAMEGEDDMAKVWEDQARSSPIKEVYEKRLARIWQETGCAAEGAPLIRQLLNRLLVAQPYRLLNESFFFRRPFYFFKPSGELVAVFGPFPFDAQSPQLHELAAAFLDEEHCPGARGLPEYSKAELKEIRDRSPPPTPKQ
jgi:uncharacterized protein YjbI with pentapeptide repeats